mmetsp:Transcript_55695/g.154167  ORF Transcript_55695/g.154167 Transcript_55695/m.154167 type:complete len:300 (-) Transcript_55695:376-1275(-)
MTFSTESLAGFRIRIWSSGTCSGSVYWYSRWGFSMGALRLFITAWPSISAAPPVLCRQITGVPLMASVTSLPSMPDSTRASLPLATMTARVASSRSFSLSLSSMCTFCTKMTWVHTVERKRLVTSHFTSKSILLVSSCTEQGGELLVGSWLHGGGSEVAMISGKILWSTEGYRTRVFVCTVSSALEPQGMAFTLKTSANSVMSSERMANTTQSVLCPANAPLADQYTFMPSLSSSFMPPRPPVPKSNQPPHSETAWQTPPEISPMRPRKRLTNFQSSDGTPSLNHASLFFRVFDCGQFT